MGEIIRATFEEILPGEEDFIDSALISLVYALGDNVPLLPVPVKRLENGMLVHLDGRHRLIVSYLMKKPEIDLFLAEDSSDFLNPKMFPEFETYKINETNQHIFQRWKSAEFTALGLDVANYHEHMYKLKSEYPFLMNLNLVKQHFFNKL